AAAGGSVSRGAIDSRDYRDSGDKRERGRVRGCDVRGGGCLGDTAGGSFYAIECGYEARTGEGIGPGRAEGGASLSGARAGDGGAVVVSGDEAGAWTGDGCRIFLQLLSQKAVYDIRPGGDRKEDGRSC